MCSDTYRLSINSVRGKAFNLYGNNLLDTTPDFPGRKNQLPLKPHRGRRNTVLKVKYFNTAIFFELNIKRESCLKRMELPARRGGCVPEWRSEEIWIWNKRA